MNDALPAASQSCRRLPTRRVTRSPTASSFPRYYWFAIPKNNAVVHGFIDGAHAAKDSVNDMKSK